MFGVMREERMMFKLIAGPCVIESEQICLDIAGHMKAITDDLGIEYIFKASIDKANRTSCRSYRGLGMTKGLDIFSKIKKEYGLKITTDIHENWQTEAVKNYVDIIQIPALLSRQTDLIQYAAATGKIVNIKKGQFMSPYDIKHAANKALAINNKAEIWLTERGTTFGYNNLVVDMRSLQIMKNAGHKVIFDATHSVQQPSAGNGQSTGQPEFIETLARAAVAIGVDGLFIETHPEPDKALSDGPNSMKLSEMRPLLERLVKIHEASHV